MQEWSSNAAADFEELDQLEINAQMFIMTCPCGDKISVPGAWASESVDGMRKRSEMSNQCLRMTAAFAGLEEGSTLGGGTSSQKIMRWDFCCSAVNYLVQGLGFDLGWGTRSHMAATEVACPQLKKTTYLN